VVIWAEFELVAPNLAAAARQRLSSPRIALLGTVRADGAPRISPIEPYITGTQLLFGAMVWSRKATDLSRDPRLALHSTLTGPDTGESEIKLYGIAVAADPAARAACPDGWWAAHGNDRAVVFAVDINEASLIEWDVAVAELTVSTWSSSRGLQVRHRSYP
jgi:pyridoxamine 5'-phosphate oxidase-like protein